MIAYPELLTGPAEDAGITVPENPREYNGDTYPHWDVFCKVQLGAPMPSWTAQWENAQVIGQIPEDKIRLVTYKQLEKLGLQVGYPMP